MIDIDNSTTGTWQFQLHPLLHGLTPAQTNFLLTQLTTQCYAPGTEIVRENESSDELYFITQGEVELLKYDEAQLHQYRIGTLAAGAAFGEIAFMQAAPRTCTVKALNEVGMMVLARASLIDHGQGTAILQQLQANIVQHLAGTLQTRTDAYVQNLQAQLQTLHTMNEFGQFFIGTVVGFSVATLMSVILRTYISVDDQSWPLVSWVYLAMMLLPVAYFMYQSARPWRDFGITWKNGRKSILEGLGISVVLLSILSLGLWGYASSVGQPASSLFGWRESWVNMLLYLPHSYLQELIGRGAMQNSLQRFFGRGQNVRTLLWSSLIFAMIHSHFGLAAMLVTFLSGLIFGLIFLRHQNLIGVAIVHWLLGVWAFSVNLL